MAAGSLFGHGLLRLLRRMVRVVSCLNPETTLDEKCVTSALAAPRSTLVILPIGAIMCRSKMMVQSGAKRHPKDASAASALASTQDRSAGRMTVLGRARSAGVTAADRGRAVPVAALGRQSVVPQGAKAEMPARRVVGVPRALAPARRAPLHHFAC